MSSTESRPSKVEYDAAFSFKLFVVVKLGVLKNKLLTGRPRRRRRSFYELLRRRRR
jgi:hypothetical protein